MTLILLLGGCGSAKQLQIVDDDCLADDEKVYPGVCGCGIAEARCLPLIDAVVHRYTFEGVGSVAIDERGSADGAVVNTELTGSGQLHLDREAALEQYVELPNGIISPLRNATFETWVSWDTPPPLDRNPFWERIFDFGVSTAGEGQRERGLSYLFLAPGDPSTVPPKPRTAYQKTLMEGEVRLDSMVPFPIESRFEVAVVVDADAGELRLYLDGKVEGQVALVAPLSAIDDVNNWLGRSQFAKDTPFGGTFWEFRIYDKALTAEQLADSAQFGPSPAFLQPRGLELQDDAAP